MPTHHPYPFTALVSPVEGRSDDLVLALLLATVSPEIGGVLVRGEKGTAKSTAVRGLADVLPPIEVVTGDRFSVDPAHPEASPDAPFADAATEVRPVRLVELPVGATEDRLLGSIHLSRALSEGVAEYEPGLLARAHRGLLYVDEVNLLHDHLVDVLLDAAAAGRATVERDGVSVTHPARFVLVGTMNPEEGELRPQLLDRFGLTVEVRAPREAAARAEVVRRRMAFDADPTAFVASYAAAQRELADRVVAARKLLPEVAVTDAVLHRVARVCAGFEVDGLRGDLVVTRTAAAHAAWQGRTTITRDDIRAAALLALPHRRRRTPFDAPGLDEDLLDRLLGDDEPEPDPEPPAPEDPGPDGPDSHGPDSSPDPSPDADSRGDAGAGDGEAGPTQGHEDRGSEPAGSMTSREPEEPGEAGTGDDPRPAAPESVAPAAATYLPRLLTVDGTGEGVAGRRSRARTTTGRRVGAAAGDRGPVHLVETVRAAIPHQGTRGRTAGATGGRLRLAADDLRVAVREGREANLVVLCVDASGSMAARKRMEQVKAAVLSLLLDAYRRRDRVGVVTFRGDGAEVLLPPTGSVDVAAARLTDLPAGGRTPLAEGLLEAAELVRRERLRDPGRRPLLVVVTDGRATHGPDAVRRAHAAAAHVAAGGTTAIVLDCETGRFRLGLARDLAAHLGASHVPIGEVSADAVAGVVRAASTGSTNEDEGRSTTRGEVA